LDLLAQFLGFKNLKDLLGQISNKGELHGMRRVRLDGEKEVTSNQGIEQHVYKSYGYRFYFKDGNDTRFDVD
jgi:hypothetical protein